MPSTGIFVCCCIGQDEHRHCMSSFLKEGKEGKWASCTTSADDAPILPQWWLYKHKQRPKLYYIRQYAKETTGYYGLQLWAWHLWLILQNFVNWAALPYRSSLRQRPPCPMTKLCLEATSVGRSVWVLGNKLFLSKSCTSCSRQANGTDFGRQMKQQSFQQGR